MPMGDVGKYKVQFKKFKVFKKHIDPTSGISEKVINISTIGSSVENQFTVVRIKSCGEF